MQPGGYGPLSAGYNALVPAVRVDPKRCGKPLYLGDRASDARGVVRAADADDAGAIAAGSEEEDVVDDATTRSAAFLSSASAPPAGTGEHMEKVVGAVALILYAITALMYVLIAVVPSVVP